MPDTDKYRILLLPPSKPEVPYERDRRQAGYIAASEAYWGSYEIDNPLLLRRFALARAALLKHIEEHP